MLQSRELNAPARTSLNGGSHRVKVYPVPRKTRATVSVIVPTLNEAKNLPYVLPHIPAWVEEVILVDGRSTDDTIAVARSLRPDIRVVMQQGRGKGNALREGFAAATGDIIVMIDADGSTDPQEIPAFVGALEAGADFAKGSRFVQGGGTADMEFHRKLGNWGFVFVSRLLFGGKYTDLCYGYNAFWRHTLPCLALDADGFEIETQMNLRALEAKLKIVEIGSFEHPRRFGTSNLHAFKDGWRVLKTIFREFVQYRRGRTMAPALPKTEIVEMGPEPVQLLLSEALHFLLQGSQNFSPANSHDVLVAFQKSFSALSAEPQTAGPATDQNGIVIDQQFLVKLEYVDGKREHDEGAIGRAASQA